MIPGVPDSLRAPVDLLASYLDRLPSTPFLAIGEFGSGRGHWVQALLADRGFHPVWLYEEEEVPAYDMEDRRLFPVYDFPKPAVPRTTPSIVLVPPSFQRSDEFKAFEAATFPPPPIWEREEFLRIRGYPPTLANGNENYAALVSAMLAWDVARVAVVSGSQDLPDWDGFRRGAEPPVVENLLAYYAAYAFPPSEWWPNRNLGLMRRSTAPVRRLLMNQLRLEWPAGKVPFPEILREPKRSKRDEQRAGFNLLPVAGTSREIPSKPKTYALEGWG